MKQIIFLSAMTFTFMVGAQEKNMEVTVSNKWEQAKTDEPVVLRLSELKKLKFDVRSAIVTLGEREIPCQLDDIDGDSHFDELVFLSDIAAGETLKYKVTLSASGKQKEYAPRVYADMMLDDKKSKHPFITSIETPGSSYIYSDLYHHGAAFESEITGYRIYFDKRQNIDLYGKRAHRLELAETCFYTTAKQKADGFGNDVLWAGNSVGCGTLKLWDGSKPADFELLKTRGQRIVAAGPLRTVVEVKDMGLKTFGGDIINMRQYYTLYAGHRECEVNVILDTPAKGESFCTGVQKVGNTAEGMTRDDGIAASWGCDYPDMGNKELFPPEAVGLAVYVPTEYVGKQLTDELNYLFVIDSEKKTSFKYYVTFCADKENEGYHSAQEWFDSLDQWKSTLQNPVEIKIR
ncbi:MAG: DUF4861 domain-containing protein [Bacteroides sp.]|nr:DUF4861 domain-containing protein [Roseburia sp.]MCM1345885.1 DUF4861 domain-containing protein [Bacteroides sp.]MCM1421237.1 DUF4861 domain-containing protein [Bacteroides sp.]